MTRLNYYMFYEKDIVQFVGFYFNLFVSYEKEKDKLLYLIPSANTNNYNVYFKNSNKGDSEIRFADRK